MYELIDLLGSDGLGERVLSLVEDIGGDYGLKPEVKQYTNYSYISYQALGFSLMFDKDRIMCALFLYDDGYQGFTRYEGALPLNLDFVMNRSQVQQCLGKPEDTGGDFYEEKTKMYQGYWDQYFLYDGKRLVITYKPHECNIGHLYIGFNDGAE